MPFCVVCACPVIATKASRMVMMDFLFIVSNFVLSYLINKREKYKVLKMC